MSKVYEQFQGNRVVRRSEVLDFFNKNVDQANNAIRWLLKSGKAQLIRAGLYYFKKPDEWYQKSVLVSPWLIASQAAEKCAIVYHSALELWGNAYSASRWVQIGVNQRKKKLPQNFQFQNAEYRFYRTNLSFGLEEKVVDDVKVKIMERERIILEALNRPDRFYGMAEFLQSIEGLRWVNLDKLFDLLPNYKTTAIQMRLGWLLERFKEKWYIKDESLKALEKDRPNDIVFLVSNKRKGNYKVNRWNLMVPKTLDRLEEA